METGVKVFAFIVTLIVAIILNGWAISWLWLWFMVKPFGLPVLGIGQSMGLAMMVSYLTWQDDSDYTKKGSSVWASLIAAILRPLITVLLGLILFHLIY